MAPSLYKWLLAGFFAVSHPFYVSVTEINHNEKQQILEISCKTFLDDMEKTLRNQYKIPVELTKPKDPKKTEQMVAEYLKKHLLLKIDGRAVVPEWVGLEAEGASLWTYLQVKGVSSVHKVEITNTILYELYDTQISIMHVQVGGNKKSTRINNPDSYASFEF
ncbi:MAG TPA: DUF6702 family protein [Chitinophagaceae bacterium]|nr:DUF6702 family protein [Chitinophagaceae bacterium]